jgi:hypothetical protein
MSPEKRVPELELEDVCTGSLVSSFALTRSVSIGEKMTGEEEERTLLEVPPVLVAGVDTVPEPPRTAPDLLASAAAITS